MTESDKKSIEEILAACRDKDGGDSLPATDSTAPAADDPKEAAPTPAAAAPDKPPGEMSVAEILAAARKDKPGQETAVEKPAEAETLAAGPTPSAASPAKKAGDMSVEEILAAARGDQSKPAAAEKVPKSVEPKPQATKSKPQAQPASGPSHGGELDTASILAAARSDTKRGPVSKEQAAARSDSKLGSVNKQQAAKADPSSTPSAPSAKAKATLPPMPKKPDFLTSSAPKVTSEKSRRGFFGAVTGMAFGSAMAVGFVSLAVTQLLWLLGLARFMFPNILTEPPTKFKVGFPDELGPGQVLTKFKAQFGVWIVREAYEGTDQIYALRTVCTHLGCTPNWLDAEQKFKCPCHGSGFYKTGVNFEGPAPRPLERYAITLADDGQLEVDKSTKFQEELGQWKDPQCFVPI